MKDLGNAKNTFVDKNKAPGGRVGEGVGKNNTRKIGKMGFSDDTVIMTFLKTKKISSQNESLTKNYFALSTNGVFHKKSRRVPRDKVEPIQFGYKILKRVNGDRRRTNDMGEKIEKSIPKRKPIGGGNGTKVPRNRKITKSPINKTI